jgi:two-component system chemotaxis response regulator CheY
MDALERLSKAAVQMLVTDLNMPNLDGIELIRRVRTLPQYKYIPIIMVTTESEDSRKQQGKAAGATGWIVKPFRAEQLVAVAKRFLK